MQSSTVTKPNAIKNKLAQYINCSKVGIHIQKVNVTKKSNLLIKVRNEEEAQVLIDSVHSNQELKTLFSANTPKAINKRIILTRVPSRFSEVQIINLLSAEINCDAGVLSIKKISKSNSILDTYILFLPADYATDLLKKRKVQLDFHTIFIRKYIRILRCYKCNCYGHSFNNCKFSICCAKCSNSHNIKDCNSNDAICVNCKSLNDDTIDCRHSADSPSCYVYQKLLKQEIEFPSFIRKNLQA